MTNHLHKAFVCENCTWWSLSLKNTKISVTTLSVEVYSQWFWFFIYVWSYFFKIFVRKDWQNRSKYFFIHKRWVFCRIQYYGWFNVFDAYVCFTAVNCLASRTVNKFSEPLYVKIIDNFALFGASSGTFTVHLSGTINNHFNKSLNLRFMYEYVVRCNASLSGVWEFWVGNFVYSVTKIGSLMHNKWTFSTKFENTRSQIFCGSSSNNLPNLSWASKTDQVQFLLVKFHRYINTTFNASDKVLI